MFTSGGLAWFQIVVGTLFLLASCIIVVLAFLKYRRQRDRLTAYTAVPVDEDWRVIWLSVEVRSTESMARYRQLWIKDLDYFFGRYFMVLIICKLIDDSYIVRVFFFFN